MSFCVNLYPTTCKFLSRPYTVGRNRPSDLPREFAVRVTLESNQNKHAENKNKKIAATVQMNPNLLGCSNGRQYIKAVLMGRIHRKKTKFLKVSFPQMMTVSYQTDYRERPTNIHNHNNRCQRCIETFLPIIY
jgi:hypothetical protein